MRQSRINLGLLILRLTLGTAFLIHGYPKIVGGKMAWSGLGSAMSSLGIVFFPAFWGFMASISEFFGGLFLISGILRIPSCFFLSCTMFIAIFFHIDKGQNFEQAFVYLLVLVTFMIMGFGEYRIKNIFSSIVPNNTTVRGRVKRLLRKKGFGFIIDVDGNQIFFHQSALVNISFEALREGQGVVFDIKHTPKGSNAVNIVAQR